MRSVVNILPIGEYLASGGSRRDSVDVSAFTGLHLLRGGQARFTFRARSSSYESFPLLMPQAPERLEL